VRACDGEEVLAESQHTILKVLQLVIVDFYALGKAIHGDTEAHGRTHLVRKYAWSKFVQLTGVSQW
jgi:hypothetical protein